MNDCPKHPGQGTMVPCLGCGRSFCRVCDAPKGAGQYCPACYRAQVERISGRAGPGEKPASGAADEKAGSRLWDRLRRGYASGAEKPDEGVGGRTGDERDGPSPGAGPGGKTVPERDGRLKGAMSVALAPFRWIGRAARAAGRGIMSAAVYVSYLPGRLARVVAWAARRLSHEIRDRFPLGMAPRELLEGDPPFKREWWKLLLFALGGAALWTLVVGLTGIRNPGFSIGVSIVVAACVVWAMGTRYGLTVAVICAGLALLSMVFGELLAQLLYRAGIIERLDVQSQSLWTLDKPVFYYERFYFKLIIWRLLPSVLVAFLIGWWPLKLRLSWAGFEGGRLEPLPPREKKVEAVRGRRREQSPGRRERKSEPAAVPGKKLRVKELPRQAVSPEELKDAMRRAAEREDGEGAPGGTDG